MSDTEVVVGDPDLRDQAVASLKRKQAFKEMVVAYVIVNALLIGVWAVSGAGYFWPVWVLGGWGIGLAFSGWAAYGQSHVITETEVASEMSRIKR
jgi:hypothetical protein